MTMDAIIEYDGVIKKTCNVRDRNLEHDALSGSSDLFQFLYKNDTNFLIYDRARSVR